LSGTCRTGSLKTVASELAKFTSDAVAVQEVRWDNGGNEPEDDCIYLSAEMGVLIIT